MTIPRLDSPPVGWREYVWRCPWGHWIADMEMCSECWWGEDKLPGQSFEERVRCPDHKGVNRGVFVWHNIHLQANCVESHGLWEMLEHGAKEEPEITQSICLHKRNEEISSPDENTRSEIVDRPPLR